MAKTYTSTIQVRCWKEHPCVGCGGLYAYELVRKVVGTGGTAEKAEINARAAVQKTLNTATDLQPCPTCGLYQPDMIGQRKASKMWGMFWVALIAFVVLVSLRGGNGLKANIATWIIAGVGAATALVLWNTDRNNPNQDTEANRQLAQQRVAAGQLRFAPGRTGVRVDELGRPAPSTAHLLALLMLLGSVAAIAAPEIVRSSQHWPLNSECYPPVVGPGDTTRIYMTESISSIKSYWRGKAQVIVREGTAVPPKSGAGDDTGSADDFVVEAKTNDNTWGSTISAKSREKSETSHPWVEVKMPNEASLANKTVTSRIRLKIEYPAMDGASSFSTRSQTMNHTVTMPLAPANAGARYNAIWWQGTGGGIALALLGGMILAGQARGFQRKANPTRTYA